eukprot:c2478_g1_i1 orf=230-2572(+)
MKSSGRRQVRTPVGKKTKRGAELEGTPKTPLSLEVSPDKSTCGDGYLQEPEDRRLQLRSRRPLQWNIAKQGSNTPGGGVGEELLENTSSPARQQQGHLKSTGESKEVAALSPICINAIQDNSKQQGWRKTVIKKPNELPPSSLSPRMKDCDGVMKRRMGNGKALGDDSDWIITEDRGPAVSVDTGSCSSSPDCRISPLSGERIFIWSNAAFNQRPVHSETVCISKNTASSSSCSSSASSSQHKAAITEETVCEAESKATDQDSLPDVTFFETKGNKAMRAYGAPDAKQGISNSELVGLGDKETKPSGSVSESIDHSESSLAKDLFPNSLLHISKATKTVGQADGNKEEMLEIGLDEIDQEIQRLTERLTELQLQKRKREEQMKRQDEDRSKKVETASSVGRKEDVDRERSVVAKLQQRQGKGGTTGAGRGKGAANISSSSASVLQSPRPQTQKGYGAKFREESPLAPVGRRHAGSVSKLSEMRRSVSTVSRRMESSNRSSDAETERTKVFRRLSLSGVVMPAPVNVQGEKSQQRSLSSKGTPSRVVSSRYGRAITPDACRLSGASSLACKKRDRPSSAASSPLPQPPASVACSPLKKVATFRSGYPSRSGFATPTKERQQLQPTSLVTTAILSSNAPASSSSCKAQNRALRVHSPSKSPISRVDSPKSTAALYKCLESLLEDSKHFFKRLSPARSHLLHNQSQLERIAAVPSSTVVLSPCLAGCSPKPPLALDLTLPSINTYRIGATSPRDSGCVKRASERQHKRFFFAKEEAIPQAMES